MTESGTNALNFDQTARYHWVWQKVETVKENMAGPKWVTHTKNPHDHLT